MKHSTEIFSLNFSPFLRVPYFCNRFFYLLMMIFPKMVVRRVLVRYKLRIHVRIREKMQNRLRRVLVFDTSERIKNVFFSSMSVACAYLYKWSWFLPKNDRWPQSVLVYYKYALKIPFVRVACALSYIQERTKKQPIEMWITVLPIFPFGCGYCRIEKSKSKLLRKNFWPCF